MGRVGIPELIVLAGLAAFWLVPVAAGIWALVTLHHLRSGQDAMARKLETLERLLQSARPSA